MDGLWEAAVQHRGLTSVLCDDQEAWDGGWGGRERQEEGNMCILRADSHCTAEINTTLKAITLQ